MKRPATPSLGPASVVHDYFAQAGGAERVAIELARLGGGKIYTSFADLESTFEHAKKLDIVESLPSARRMARIDPRAVLPVMPHAFRRLGPMLPSGVVLASSSGWAHRVAHHSDSPVFSYMHSPARWLYEPADYFKGSKAGGKVFRSAFARRLVEQDREESARVHTFIANSRVVQERIFRAYGRDSVLINPPVMVDRHGVREPVSRLAGERFFLLVGRSRGYKNAEAAVRFFERRPERTLVLTGGIPQVRLPKNVIALGRVSESVLRWLYSEAAALLALSFEDFGLTPVEGHMFGTPTIALQAGGYLETCLEGENAVFLTGLGDHEIADGFSRFEDTQWSSKTITGSAERFGSAVFLEKVAAVLSSA